MVPSHFSLSLSASHPFSLARFPHLYQIVDLRGGRRVGAAAERELDRARAEESAGQSNLDQQTDAPATWDVEFE